MSDQKKVHLADKFKDLLMADKYRKRLLNKDDKSVPKSKHRHAKKKNKKPKISVHKKTDRFTPSPDTDAFNIVEHTKKQQLEMLRRTYGRIIWNPIHVDNFDQIYKTLDKMFGSRDGSYFIMNESTTKYNGENIRILYIKDKFDINHNIYMKIKPLIPSL